MRERKKDEGGWNKNLRYGKEKEANETRQNMENLIEKREKNMITEFIYHTLIIMGLRDVQKPL